MTLGLRCHTISTGLLVFFSYKMSLAWFGSTWSCINQEDLEERKTQVEMMYQIYRGAKEVIVDLGYQSNGSEKLAGLLEQIRQVVYEECNRDIHLHAGQHTLGALAASGRDRLPPTDDIVWRAFRKFLERPWFTRVWVVQEAIAAKKLTVMCGYWAMNGATLFFILEVANEWQLPCLPTHSEGQHKWENNAAVGFRQIMLMLHLRICDKDDFYKTPLTDRPKGYRLIGLLERSRHAKSTDPRDRVFAFLNLCGEEERRFLRPDYTETVAERWRICEGGKVLSKPRRSSKASLQFVLVRFNPSATIMDPRLVPKQSSI